MIDANTAAVMLMLALLSGGLAVWSGVVHRWIRQQPVIPQAGQSPLRWPPAAIVIAVLLVGTHVLSQIQSLWEPAADEVQPRSVDLSAIQINSIVQLASWGLLLFVLAGAGKRPLEDFGIHLKRWKSDAGYGALGYLAAFPGVLGILLITQVLRTEDKLHPYISTLLTEPSAVLLVWIGFAVVVAAPLQEELLFRVVVQGSLRSRLPAGAAIVLSSLLFAGVHGFPDSLALVPLALVLGYVYEKRRSYLAVVLLHALFNAQMLAGLLLQMAGTD